jgi:PAS domain S-box-containing protein
MRAEEALQQREKQLNDIVQNASETIYTFAPDGIFTFVSSAWTQNLGHDVADVLGHSFTEFIHPDDVPRCVYLISRMQTTGKPRESTEYRVRHKDGSWRWHRTSGSVLRDSQGKPTGYVGVAEDITARKQAELKLAEAKQAAEEANRAKSQFLANMSHEIRTPLTAIMGYADVLVGALSKSEDRQAAAIIKRNGEHLLAVINDILDLSKIEANRFEVDRVACSPCQILAEVESLMSVGAGAKHLPLLFKGDGLLPETITSDPVRLRQILINLIGNAIKFTENGSVQVVMRLAAEPTTEPKLQIDVIDTGIGMSEQQVQRLFQPFVQADNSTTRRFGGTGLGLLISKRLAVTLGGDISISTAAGEGSTFRLTVATGPLDGIRCAEYPERVLPSADQIAAPAPAAITLNCRVLLAEDGFDNQRLISLLLRKAGANVTVVENGQEAVDRVLAAQSGHEDAEPGLTRPFDIVLMDLQMPVMDGYEATRRLRKRGFRGPILALTAYAMPQDIDHCLVAGCSAHLSKPIDRDTLLRTISRFLRPAEAALAANATASHATEE